MWCWRRMLRIPWSKRRTNASLLEEIGVSKRLLHTINIQMLSFFGHIARRKDNNLEKVIIQGMSELKRRKGRPRSRWIDQIRSAIGLPLRDCYALAEDRHLWRPIYEVTSCQPWQERTNQPTWRSQIHCSYSFYKVLPTTAYLYLTRSRLYSYLYQLSGLGAVRCPSMTFISIYFYSLFQYFLISGEVKSQLKWSNQRKRTQLMTLSITIVFLEFFFY